MSKQECHGCHTEPYADWEMCGRCGGDGGDEDECWDGLCGKCGGAGEILIMRCLCEDDE